MLPHLNYFMPVLNKKVQGLLGSGKDWAGAPQVNSPSTFITPLPTGCRAAFSD
jgi:hypothetical protein